MARRDDAVALRMKVEGNRASSTEQEMWRRVRNRFEVKIPARQFVGSFGPPTRAYRLTATSPEGARSASFSFHASPNQQFTSESEVTRRESRGVMLGLRENLFQIVR
jgi:hypothetical protein